MQTSSEVINPRVLLASVETRPRRPGKEPMQLDDMKERRQLDKGRKSPKSGVEEQIVINDNYPEQLVTIGGGLSAECRHALIHTLRKIVDVFAWTPADLYVIPMRKVVTDEVNEWLKAGSIPFAKDRWKIESLMEFQYIYNVSWECLNDTTNNPKSNLDKEGRREDGFPYGRGSLLLHQDAFWSQECRGGI
ncbi:hypothetical protein Tco_0728472 [Tanacetum coccineum]|uniref:Reverse transcriptase domain-containing protein n=1 Tax=Tanacetum coccineum TaxID=301880 RepID=A0ABQ4YM94_9ASTR